MITLTTDIDITYGATKVRKYKVLSFQVRDEDPNGIDASYTPNVLVKVSVYGNNSAWLGCFCVVAYNSLPSTCISNNASPDPNMHGTDQVVSTTRVCAGAYTALAAAANTSGTHNAKKLAVETALVPNNLMDAAFAGTT